MVSRAGDRAVEARRAEEADAVAAALQQAEGAADLRDLVSRLSTRLAEAAQRIEEMKVEARDNVRAVRKAEVRAEALHRRLAQAECDTAEQERRTNAAIAERDAARLAEGVARAALLAEQSRVKGADRRALEADARVAAAEAERDAARAEEAAATRREEALRKRLQAAEARLAALSTGAPSPVAHVEAVGQVTGAEVCLWVRQTRALSALRDVPAARWDRDDAAQLRRQVYRLQQCAPGADRAALSERVVALARTLGGG